MMMMIIESSVVVPENDSHTKVGGLHCVGS